ncbi:YcxB family protein [Microbacterium sp. GXF0217]
MTDAPRYVQVDRDLLTRMSRDATIFLLTRPLSIFVWVLLGVGLVWSLIPFITALTAAPSQAGRLVVMPALFAGLMVLYVLFTAASVRRSLTSAMPEGTSVSVRVGANELRVESARGTSRIPFTGFRRMKAGRDAVMLQLRSSSAMTALPRAVVSDADIEHLREKIG